MIGENVTLGIIIGAALADSINPCVIGVLVFLMLFLGRAFKSRVQMLLAGLWYSLIVYVTYLALGFGILKTAVSIGFAETFYWIAAVVAIIAGLLEIKDYFWYGRGFTLQMWSGGSDRLKSYTQKIEIFYQRHPRIALFLVGFLGIFVVMVELPCTGAPYFAVLALLAKGDYATAVPYLLVYNFVFIVPLLVVIVLAFMGRAERIEAWRLEHRGLMRLGIGSLLIALGAYMIYSVVSI